jgi:hypothetical protein
MPIIPPAKSQPSVPVKATEESPNGRYYFKIVVSPPPELERLLGAVTRSSRWRGPGQTDPLWTGITARP